MSQAPAYIIAARRSALGRVGGLHRHRRIEDLAAPVLSAALGDAKIAPTDVDELIVGNATQGGNPARLIALAAGLPGRVAASTVDRQCGSGLDAIIQAARAIAAGDAGVVVAGGAESISTAPWRIAKPKSLYQLPHFLGLEPMSADRSDEPQLFEASEALSAKLGISRAQQDQWAMRSHLKADAARDARRFVGEIVPLRSNVEEARDESAVGPSPSDLERLTAFIGGNGTLTSGNTSALHDGAAFVVVVSHEVWERLGKPPALKLLGSAAEGVEPEGEASAPIEAVRRLFGRVKGFNPKDIGAVELSESSAAQAIAFAAGLGFDDDILNEHGGAIVRGHPLGAAGAVLVVRLFTRMIRASGAQKRPAYGVVALGTIGGMGLAALFQAV